MASSKPRSSCSFLDLLMSLFSLALVLLSAASVGPTLLLRLPPSFLGWAFLAVSALSLSSAFIGLCPCLARSCFRAYVSLVIASSASQLLGIVALFAREKSSLSMLKSPRDPREAKALARLECGVLMAMFAVQLGVMILCCAVSCCMAREYEGLDAAETKENNKEVKKMEFDEKMMRSKAIWAVDEEA
ncbi:Putative membrane lipoprotein [Striga hermonthica]|uniref:Membrane lipoprotein n=1 Tax=Striga hermonthica TaxID=68872 RepID=A0A9N7MU03_STRHE|nr:Putative membrane lipoprotein [Striga hermonthica]